MSISHELRAMAAEKGQSVEQAAAEGMAAMSEVFKAKGAQVYLPADEVGVDAHERVDRLVRRVDRAWLLMCVGVCVRGWRCAFARVRVCALVFFVAQKKQRVCVF